MASGQSAEDAIEEEKADAKIGIHVSRAVDAVMMNIVKAPCAAEPAIDQRHACHPEIAKMHGIVKKAEGEERPDNEVAKHNHLVNGPYVKQEHNAPTESQNGNRRSEPFKTDVAERKTPAGSVSVTLSTHRLHWSVKEEVVNHVTATQKGQLVTMKQPMQPIAGQLRNEARTDDRF